MAHETPVTDLDSDFSSPGATALPWTEAERQLRAAGIFWLTTVRPEGRPHVVPLNAVWLDGALYFSTGETERKAKNLATNTHVAITTGSNARSDELDLVVEGEADVVSDDAKLRRVADAYATKYGEDWRPGGDGGIVFEVVPTTAFGFGRGDAKGPPPQGGFSQTRWRFQASPPTTRPR